MNTRMIKLGALSLVALGIVALATSAYAYQGNPTKVGPGYAQTQNGVGQGLHNGQGRGMIGQERGQNRGGNFVDANKDGICDHMQ